MTAARTDPSGRHRDGAFSYNDLSHWNALHSSFASARRLSENTTTSSTQFGSPQSTLMHALHTSVAQRHARSAPHAGNFNWLPAAGYVSVAHLNVRTHTESDRPLISHTKGQLPQRNALGHQLRNSFKVFTDCYGYFLSKAKIQVNGT